MFRKIALGLMLSIALFAQNYATVTGSVSDVSNANVAGAKITVQNLETLVVKEVTANDDGTFSVPFLIPGRYKVTAQKERLPSIRARQPDARSEPVGPR